MLAKLQTTVLILYSQKLKIAGISKTLDCSNYFSKKDPKLKALLEDMKIEMRKQRNEILKNAGETEPTY